MQKDYYLSTPHLARSITFISACALLCVCQNEGECMRARERERERGGQFTCC